MCVQIVRALVAILIVTLALLVQLVGAPGRGSAGGGPMDVVISMFGGRPEGVVLAQDNDDEDDDDDNDDEDDVSPQTGAVEVTR